MESNTEVAHLRQQLEAAHAKLKEHGILLNQAAHLLLDDLKVIFAQRNEIRKLKGDLAVALCRVDTEKANCLAVTKERNNLVKEKTALCAQLNAAWEKCEEYNKAFPWLVTAYAKDGTATTKRFQKLDDAAQFGVAQNAAFDVIYNP